MPYSALMNEEIGRRPMCCSGVYVVFPPTMYSAHPQPIRLFQTAGQVSLQPNKA